MSKTYIFGCECVINLDLTPLKIINSNMGSSQNLKKDKRNVISNEGNNYQPIYSIHLKNNEQYTALK